MNAQFEKDPFNESTSTAYGVDSERSTKSLLRELMHEVPELFTKEVALARAEMRENLAQTRRGAAEVSTGGVVLAGGYIMLLLAAVYALSEVMEPWLAALLVGGVAALIGYSMVKAGMRHFSARDLKPDRTIDSVHKDADAIRGARHGYH
ncbi:MAG TPA: phage holin family protein [Xanthomonadaceae bacterium]|nr:phage holin family protein [Xanthomonadaceae bacterium]